MIPPNLIQPRHLVIRGVNWLGDAVMSTPALLRLRERFPNTQITLVTPSKLAALYEPHPAVDRVLPIDPGSGVFQVAARIRALKADTALILPNSPRTALECFLAGVPSRFGYRRSWRTFLLTHPVIPRSSEVRMKKRSLAEIRRSLGGPSISPAVLPPGVHHVHQYLHLAAAMGASAELLAPLIQVTEREKSEARTRWSLDPSSPPKTVLRWIGINPGAEYGPAKRWPVERFAGAAVRLAAQPGVGIVILGGPGDVQTASVIEESLARSGATGNLHHRNAAGKTNLRELIGLIANCAAVLTNDTGPMHLAAAAGSRVVALFGSTSAELTAPGLPGDDSHRFLTAGVPCAPCFLKQCPIDSRCLMQISIDRAVAAVGELLK